MKSIHNYEKYADNISVSDVFKPINLGVNRYTLHHSLKDGLPQTYWFSFFHYTTGYVEFDVRDWWQAVGIEPLDSWSGLSTPAALEMLANMIMDAFNNGHVLHETVRKLNCETAPVFP